MAIRLEGRSWRKRFASIVRCGRDPKKCDSVYHDHFYRTPLAMALTISQLRMLTAVAEHGSIRAASRALGIAQSGITQQLQNLESLLGATLFTRTNRGIALTALGQRMLQRAATILGECERAAHDERRGKVGVSCRSDGRTTPRSGKARIRLS